MPGFSAETTQTLTGKKTYYPDFFELGSIFFEIS